MKKFIFVLLALTICFGIHCHAADRNHITATLSQDGNKVNISGTTGSGAAKEVTLCVTNSRGEISYINQTTSNSEGAFGLLFPHTYNLIDGTYTARIGGEGIASPTVITFDYVSPDNVKDPNENKLERFYDVPFVDADITVALSNYVPTLTGTVSCEWEKYVNICVTNTTDNSVVVNESLTFADGIHNLSYTFPSLLKGKNYKITFSAGESNDEQLKLEVYLNTSIALTSFDAALSMGDSVWVDASLETVTTELVNKSVTFHSNTSFTTTLPNILPYASFKFTATGHESYTEDKVTEITKSRNQPLYDALKKERPNLDSDNDGVITNTELSDITGTLDLSNSGIKTLVGLKYCTSVTGINVSHNKITSLRPLSTLDKLVYVDAHDNNITNISTMPASIRYFNIDDNNVTGLHGLKNAQNLEMLSASGNPIKELSGIWGKSKLRYLNLKDAGISDVYLLKKCTMLSYLNIGTVENTDFSPLEELEHLYYFYK